MKTKILLSIVGMAVLGCASATSEQSNSPNAVVTDSTITWQKFDSDNNGMLSLAEYSQMEILIFSALDKNGDGSWTRREFVKRKPDMSLGRLDALRGRFKRGDKNEDDLWDTNEASAAIKSRFNWLDKNNNGQLAEKEFPNFW